jgi:hypothetical protein
MLSLVVRNRVYASYVPGSDRQRIQLFRVTMGWPFRSYETNEGSLSALKLPDSQLALERVDSSNYVHLYDSKFDAIHFALIEEWKPEGILGNAAVAALLALLLTASVHRLVKGQRG